MPSTLVIFQFGFHLLSNVRKMRVSNFDLTSTPAQQVFLKAETHVINPMKNMFTGKQNVINPTNYQVFHRKQKPAGILLTSVSCDADGQKS